MDQPRDSVEEWEFRVRTQFERLEAFARDNGCALGARDLPERDFGKSGQEHEVYHAKGAGRYWKSTFPGEAGRGPFGFYVPAGYLRRLRLSNRIFGDDVAFEGIWQREDGSSIVTSQSFIQPHPERFIPSEAEIEEYLGGLGFAWDQSAGFWVRDEDGVQLGDTHNRNFMRAPDGELYAIDAQPRQPAGCEVEEALEYRR